MTPTEETHFTDTQVSAMLGKHPVTVRKWRSKNTAAGCIKFGPPYVFIGPNVWYPKDQFREWCSRVVMVNGVPRMNMPVAPQQQSTVIEETSDVAG